MFLEAENVLRLKVSRGRNCLGAESVSQLFSGLKVSPDWKFLPAESFSEPQMSQGWKCLPAESFSEPQVSQGWNCHNWKCLRAESVFHPHGWKCLAAENVWAANFSQWKLSQGWKCLKDANPRVQTCSHFPSLLLLLCTCQLHQTTCPISQCNWLMKMSLARFNLEWLRILPDQ